MSFTKLDHGILRSSVMAESPEAFKVWIAFLASCEADGVARVSSVYLASVCHLPIEAVDAAIAALASADPRSRSTSEGGRRIVRIDGGYKVVNYEKYRGWTYSQSPEAVRQRRKRDKNVTKRHGGVTSRDVSISVSSSLISYSFLEDTWINITEHDLEAWRSAYPACKIELELKRAGEWLKANPTKKKSNYRRFLVNWFNRAQDSGGTRGGVKFTQVVGNLDDIAALAAWSKVLKAPGEGYEPKEPVITEAVKLAFGGWHRWWRRDLNETADRPHFIRCYKEVASQAKKGA